MSSPPSSSPARAMRAAEENWDADFDFPDSPARRPPVQAKASKPSSSSPVAPLAPFPRVNAEAGPSTPARATRKRPAGPEERENWDDDFTFPSPPRAPAATSASTSARRRARSAAQNNVPASTSNRMPRRVGSYAPPSPTREGEQENWDADFEFGRDRERDQDRAPKSSTGALSWSSSDSDRELGDLNELGVLTPSKADEEDRTVTARHKRVPVPIKLDTPPPVPPLPAGLPTSSHPRSPLGPRAPSSLSVQSEMMGYAYEPPRSPAVSLFSLPAGGSGRESSLGGHTMNTYSSTAALALRQTMSSASSRSHLGAHAFAFPPTPPQPRERRRLRKKRDRDDAMELRDVDSKAVLRKRRPLPRAEDLFDPARRQSIEEEPEGFSDDPLESDVPSLPAAHNSDLERPHTPDLPLQAPNLPVFTQTSAPATPPFASPAQTTTTTSSPSNRTPLLARIGSVTKWGARKKRSSTVPSDRSPGGTDMTPRPPSSLAGQPRIQPESPSQVQSQTRSQPTPPLLTSPPSNKGWFRSPPADLTSLTRKDSASRLRALLAAPTSPSKNRDKRKGASMPPLLGLMQRTASSGTDDVPLDDLVLPAQPMLNQMLPPPLPQKSDNRISRRLSALALPGRAQKVRNLSYGGSSGAQSRSSLSVNQLPPVPLPPGSGLNSNEPTPRKISTSRSRSRMRGIMSPSQDSLAGRGSIFGSASNSGAGKRPEEEGSNLMARVRRLSFAKKHRSSRSLAAAPELPASSSAPVPQPNFRFGRMDPPKMSNMPPLLPPIELQPPSPPDTMGRADASSPSLRQSIEALRSLTPMELSSSTSPSPSPLPFQSSPHSPPLDSSPPSPPLSARAGAKSPASPGTATASLGRATVTPTRMRERDAPESPAQRRSSLGDLKIPARISQAQVGLRMNLGMVREFAASIERLRELQTTYFGLITELQAILNAPPSAPPSSASPTTPSSIPHRRPGSRARSNTNPAAAPSHAHLASALHTIGAKYRIAWECAELLIELGGGPPADGAGASRPAPTSSSSVPLVPVHTGSSGGHSHSGAGEGRSGRERAITLESKAGDEAPGVMGAMDPTWRGSSGRNDLSRRQLLLLRDMLQGQDTHTPSNSPPVGISPQAHDEREREQERPQSVNRGWRWGDPASSTITLPSEEGGGPSNEASPLRKRQSGMRLGMRGLRDMLKSLKKQGQGPPPLGNGGKTSPALIPPVPPIQTRPRSKTSSAAQSVRSTHQSIGGMGMPPSASSTMSHHHPSPRRPSLAGIFRLGQRHRSGTGPGSSSGPGSVGAGASSGGQTPEASSDAVPSVGMRTASESSRPSSTSSEEDWDHMDSGSEEANGVRRRPGGTQPHANIGSGTGARTGPGTGTVRIPSAAHAKSPYGTMHERSPTARPSLLPTASQSSIFTDAASGHSHYRKLSNVEEQAGASTSNGPSRRASVRSNRNKSVRMTISPSSTSSASGSQPMSLRARVAPQLAPHQAHQTLQAAMALNMDMDADELLPDPQLAMTPENIRPLLDNAREVHARLTECVSEVRGLLAVRS